MEADWKEFIQKKKGEYQRIGHIECPAFGNEKIYFNKHGFNHLIRKEGVLRPKSEQMRRLNLVKYATTVLRKAIGIYKYEKRQDGDLIAYFWTFKYSIGVLEIKVVIRQVGNGRKHFFSIMDPT